MNESDRMLTLLEPPPGGWERLRARRNLMNRWAPSWWALASGSAAAMTWFAIASGQTQIRMQLTGARLIGERSQGADLRILGDGRAVAQPTADSKVRIYWIEPANSTPAKPK
jgi:hypothetical protein